jgi:hypothetical protein
MAERFYGLDRGDTEFGVTEGSSTTATTDVEVRVDLASNTTKSEVLILLDMIKNHIIKGNWPPA